MRSYSQYCRLSTRQSQERRQGSRAKEWKVIEAQRAEPPTPNQAIDVLIGYKKQNEKQEKERNPNPATLDSSFASYNQQGSHNESILLTAPSPQGMYKYLFIYYIPPPLPPRDWHTSCHEMSFCKKETKLRKKINKFSSFIPFKL